jgi:4-hydroxy-tetrahydrodipicolinate reductase
VRLVEEPAWEPVHVWIDFSRPEGTLRLLETISTPVLIGTTGFTEGQLEKIKAYAQKQPVLLAPNTSPGMNLMMAFLRRVPVPESLGFDRVLNEEHHRYKKDAPSGTAKGLLEILNEGGPPLQVNVTRAGGIKGTHSVKWVSDEEELVIEHRVIDRKVFAKGALLGARFLLKNKVPGVHRMEEVFS